MYADRTLNQLRDGFLAAAKATPVEDPSPSAEESIRLLRPAAHFDSETLARIPTFSTQHLEKPDKKARKLSDELNGLR